ncbi:MAG: signal peptidase I [Candidatus Micrarchaeota archaeon]
MKTYTLIKKIALILAIFIAAFLLLSLFLGTSNFTATVETNSMQPFLEKGDLVILKKQSNYEERDVIVFYKNQEVIIHRISRIENNSYFTKGDANNNEDSGYRTSEEVIGKNIFVLKGLGWWNLWISGK